jgi:gamma-glutamylcyclotransferase
MYYFAYSSNLSRQQMLKRCPQVKILQSAVLPNYKLVFSGWSREWRGGVATIQSSHGDRVAGGIYEISEQDLSRLDKCENYPTEYTRTRITVYPDMGPALEAVTYVRPKQLESSKPSAEYLAVIRQGYQEWGLV